MKTFGEGLPGIRYLPNEIIREILLYVSTNELMATHRIVSRVWNQLATEICQRRYVKLKSNYVRHVLQCYEDLPNPLWSSICLDLCAHKFVENRHSERIVSIQIAEVFGSQIRSLSIDACDDYGTLISILKRLHNLEKLKISTAGILEPLSTTFQLSKNYSEPHLRKLKKLKILSGLATSFIKFLVCTMKVNLESLYLALQNVSFTDFETLVQVMLAPNINGVSLKLVYDLQHFPTWQRLLQCESQSKLYLKIQKLEVISTGSHIDCFQSLSHLLLHCRNIKKLKLDGFTDLMPLVPAYYWWFKMPPMPNLVKLKITFPEGPPEDISFIHFKPLSCDLLPSLHKVNLSNTNDRALRNVELKRMFMTRFDTVKILIVDLYHGGGGEAWADVFPNVIKLRVTVKTSKELADIFEHMKHLEDINLTIQTLADVNDLMRKGFYHAPKLNSLKKLQLKSHSIQHEKFKLLARGSRSLFFLRPMELTIVAAELSNACISELRDYHLCVRLL